MLCNISLSSEWMTEGALKLPLSSEWMVEGVL